MNLDKLDKKFVSDIDQFLEELRANTSKSKSELVEIQKHSQLFAMRDVKKSACQ